MVSVLFVVVVMLLVSELVPWGPKPERMSPRTP